jgi:purine-binding chemotaxis protein CheW
VTAASSYAFTEPVPSSMSLRDVDRWVVFSLDAGRYALPLTSVVRIVRAAEITPLPRAPLAVLGALDIAGQVLPVFNVRRKFGLPEREVEPADQFLIARSAHRRVVLPIDFARGVFDCQAGAAIEAAAIAPELTQLRGVVRLPDGLALIYDLDLFLSADEARALDDSLMRDLGHAD